MIVRCEVEFGKPTPLTENEKKEIEALRQKDDSDIDYSDIPEMSEERLKRFRPLKDVLDLRKHA